MEGNGRTMRKKKRSQSNWQFVDHYNGKKCWTVRKLNRGGRFEKLFLKELSNPIIMRAMKRTTAGNVLGKDWHTEEEEEAWKDL